MLAKHTEPKSKKKVYIEKLQRIDDENERFETEILRMMSKNKVKLNVGDSESKNIAEESIKLMRKMNEKTMMEKQKNIRIYYKIKEKMTLMESGVNDSSDLLKREHEKHVKKIEAEKALIVKDKDEMIEYLQKELFEANDKTKNLQLIIEHANNIKEEEIRRRRNTFVLESENMTEKLQKVLKKREDELDKARKTMKEKEKEIQEEKNYVRKIEELNETLKMEITRLKEERNGQEKDAQVENVRLLDEAEKIMLENKSLHKKLKEMVENNKDEKEEMEKLSKSLREETLSLSEKLKEMEKEREEERAEKEVLLKSKEALKEEVEHYEQNKLIMIKNEEIIQQDKSNLLKELDQIKIHHQEISANNQHQLNRSNEVIKELRTKVDELVSSAEFLSAELKLSNEMIVQHEQEKLLSVTKMESKLLNESELFAKINDLQLNLNQVSAELILKQREKEEEIQRYETKLSEHELLTRKIEGLETTIGTLEEALMIKEREFQITKANYEQLVANSEVLMLQIKDFNLKLSFLQSTIISKDEKIQKLEGSLNSLSNSQNTKSQELTWLREEFNKVKTEINMMSEAEKKTEKEDSEGSSQSIDTNNIETIQVELEIYKEKYEALEAKYQKRENISKTDIHIPILKLSSFTQTDQTDSYKDKTDQAAQSEFENTKMNPLKELNSSENSLKNVLDENIQIGPKKEFEEKLDISVPLDEEEFLKDINRNSTLNSPSSAINLNNLFNQSDLHNKIPNFSYKSSILHQIYTIKHITSPEAKIIFIFQYACFLELYFSSEFLNGLRWRLLTGEQMETTTIGNQDLNMKLVEVSSEPSENSFSMQSTSRAGSNGSKLFIMNQFSHTYSKTDESHHNNLMHCFSVYSINLSGNEMKRSRVKTKLESFETDLTEMRSLFLNGDIKMVDFTENPEIYQKIRKLKENEIGKMFIQLIDENKAVKKCLNQMIKNEEFITNNNNDMYFQESETNEDAIKEYEEVEKRVLELPQRSRASSNLSKISSDNAKDSSRESENDNNTSIDSQGKSGSGADKENCSIM